MGRTLKTHCKRGHEFTPENTYARADGGRECRACKYAPGREYARCRRGHELTSENVRLSPKGQRMCRICNPIRTHCKKGHALTSDNVYQDGRGVKCKICTISRTDRWVKNNPARVKTTRDKWKAENPNYEKDSYRERLLRSEYDLSVAQYEQMLEAQNGVCAICKQPEKTKGINHLSVDHDHITGQIRALLCRACNSGLGLFKDNLTLLDAAADYLRTHEEIAVGA